MLYCAAKRVMIKKSNILNRTARPGVITTKQDVLQNVIRYTAGRSFINAILKKNILSVYVGIA